tara:strand:- start:284 stop:589 length:306 start_codon:yes stop_codon:yes gene_type:complete
VSKTFKEMEADLQTSAGTRVGLYSYETVDAVNHPPHYTTGGIETLDVIRAKMSPDRFQGYLMGNALKYLLRCEYKEKRVEDIKKAQFYINSLVEEMDKDAD